MICYDKKIQDILDILENDKLSIVDKLYLIFWDDREINKPYWRWIADKLDRLKNNLDKITNQYK